MSAVRVSPRVSSRVSIGLPVYNGGSYLAEALDSLRAQTFQDFEVVICDNASTDSTEAIARRFCAEDPRFSYHRNAENLGAARNFNKAFELSSGEYFKWFGHDDVLSPDYLERCVEALDRADESVVLAFPQARYIHFNGVGLDLAATLKIRGISELVSYDGISFAGIMALPPACFPILIFGLVRRSALERTRLIGSYVASDLVLVAELRLLGQFLEIPDELFHQRIHRWEQARTERNSVVGEAGWFDPRIRRPRFPTGFNLVREHIRGIHHVAPELKVRWAAYRALPRFVSFRVRTYLYEFVTRQWSQVSTRIADGASLWPVRLWFVLAALRQRDTHRLREAMIGRDPRARRLLHLFLASRLGRRNERYSEETLISWLCGSDPERQLAAALAIARSPSRFDRALRARTKGAGDGSLIDAALTAALRDRVVEVEALDDTELRNFDLDSSLLAAYLSPGP